MLKCLEVSIEPCDSSEVYTIGSSNRRNSYMYDLLYVGSAKGSDIELMPKNSYGGAHGNSD
jgi:hypothetical protein